MRKSRFTEEQIVGILQEYAAGAKVSELCRRHGMSDATLYKWKSRYGGMQVSELRRLKDLEAENAELKRLLAETLLAQAGMPDDEIASVLTSEGHRSPNCADKVLPITIQRIRLAAGIKVAVQRDRWHHESCLLSANDLAMQLGVPVNWLYVQIRKKRLLIDRQPSGAYLFPNTSSVFESVRSLRNHAISSLDLRINQPDKEGHQHE